jgi:two-component system KDP operon response regulator KdpE
MRYYRTGSKSLYSVLVIDDESQIRRFVKIGLELQGYTVTSANTGAAGLEAAVHNLPDVIILDLPYLT